MVNDLDNDPRIHEHFQFWFFTYDTGNPILYSAMRLRELLTAAVAQLDPEGTDPALHAHGGDRPQPGRAPHQVDRRRRRRQLLAACKTPLDEMKLSDKTRELLRRLMFLKPLPFVQRVVFIATPHRGSYFAGNWFAHQFARFITMPARSCDAAPRS